MTAIVPSSIFAIALLGLATITVVTALFSLIAWERLVIAVGRRKLLLARNEVFFLFAESEFGIDHPAHREVREMLNRFTRYAHKLTWWRMVTGTAALAKWDRPGMIELAKLRQAAPEFCNQIDERVHQAYRAVFEMMEQRSGLLFMAKLMSRLSTTIGVWLALDAASTETKVDRIALAAEQEELAGPSGRRLRAA